MAGGGLFVSFRNLFTHLIADDTNRFCFIQYQSPDGREYPPAQWKVHCGTCRSLHCMPVSVMYNVDYMCSPVHGPCLFSFLWGRYTLLRIQPNSDMMNVCLLYKPRHDMRVFIELSCGSVGSQMFMYSCVVWLAICRMSVSASSITQRPLQEQHSMRALLVSAPGWTHPQETRPQQQRHTQNTPYSHLLKVPLALLLSSELVKHLACLCVCFAILT